MADQLAGSGEVAHIRFPEELWANKAPCPTDQQPGSIRRHNNERVRDILRASGIQLECGTLHHDHATDTLPDAIGRPYRGNYLFLVDRGRSYPLKPGVNLIGRSKDNDIVLADMFVSRHHCVILVGANQTCELYDLVSKNGTFLNGTALTATATLELGDELGIGSRVLFFVTLPGTVNLCTLFAGLKENDGLT